MMQKQPARLQPYLLIDLIGPALSTPQLLEFVVEPQFRVIIGPGNRFKIKALRIAVCDCPILELEESRMFQFSAGKAHSIAPFSAK